MKIKVCRKNRTPLYLQIKNQIKEMILNGELINGVSLPSERGLAKDLHVHRNTIIRAYQELKADELVHSSKGQYYSVTYESVGSTSDVVVK
jgi:DNA-binding transcriptional regulator YhcF (GntR family)